MIVGHIDPNPVVQFRPGVREIVESGVGKLPITRKSVVIHFEPFGVKKVKTEAGLVPVYNGIPTSKVPTRFGSGKLLSKIDTEQVAKKLGVEQDVLDEWFKSHPSWGKRMIDINEETTEAVGDGGDGDGIEPNGDGSYSCLVCRDEHGDPKYIKDGRGLTGHKNSNAHKDGLAAQREQRMAALGA
jgi:hypothetical protein